MSTRRPDGAPPAGPTQIATAHRREVLDAIARINRILVEDDGLVPLDR